MATIACSFSHATCSLSFPASKSNEHISSLLSLNFLNSLSVSKTNRSLKLPRRRISHATSLPPERACRALTVSGLVDGDPEADPEVKSSDLNSGATIDIKLPRRSLLVQFTCDECGERTNRLINRLAYERGLVYVQCAGCLRHHKLVDNLGLVIEYDLREETSIEQNTDQA